MRIKRNNLVMFSLATGMFLSSIGTSIANIALPKLTQAFAATYSEIQWVIVSYLLSNTICIVAAGKVGDHFGRQKVLKIGILIFSLSSLFCGLSQTLWMLILGRVFQGISSAFLMSLTVALVSDLIPKERIGRAMGLLGTASAIGTASGPSVGGVILNFFEWSSIFYFLGIIGMIVFVVHHQLIPRVFGSGQKDSHPRFVFTSLQLGPLSSSFFMNVCVSTVMMSTLVAGPFFLSNTLHLESSLVGAVMTVGPLASIISGFPAGRAVDRVGPAKIIIIGLGFLILGALSFSFLPSTIGVLGYVTSAALLSPGYQMFQAGNNSMVMSGVSHQQKGVVSGLLSLSRNLGLIIGASGMGMIFSMFGMKTTFLVAAIIASLALFLAAKKASFKGVEYE